MIDSAMRLDYPGRMVLFVIVAAILYFLGAVCFLLAEAVFQEIEGVLFGILGTLFLVCACLERLRKDVRDQGFDHDAKVRLKQLTDDVAWFREQKSDEIRAKTRKDTR